jgi:outer membrane protein assembly factor BamB
MNFGPGTQSALYARDMKSGEVLWKAEPPKGPPSLGGGGLKLGVPASGGAAKAGFDNASMLGDLSGKGGYYGSWCSPVVHRSGGRDELILVESTRVAAYDLKTGKVLWTCKGLPPQVFASPAVGEGEDDGVVVAMGHISPVGTKVIAIKLGGTGEVSETHRLWEVNLKRECVGSGVIAQGCVFLVATNGFALCLDLKTGKLHWEERIPGDEGSWSSLVVVNGRLVVANQAGQVSVMAAAPKFEVLHTNIIPAETTCSSLAFANGHVLLRTHQALWCFGKGP